MTPESTQVAAMIDRYPEHIRARLAEAVERIVEVYRASGVQERWVGSPPRPTGVQRAELPDNVVLLRRPA